MCDWTVILSFLVLCCTIYYWLTRDNYFKKNGIIHEKPLPFFGNSASLLFQRTSFIDHLQRIYDLDKEAKYVGFYDMDTPVILIRDPELIRTIAVKNFDHFIDHRGFSNSDVDPLFDRNLLSLRGNAWREMRNLLSPAFTSSKMKAMFKLMSSCAESFADYLVSQAEAEPYTVNSKDIFTRYTNDVIATCAFGVAVDSMRNPNNEFYVLGKKATTFEGLKMLKVFIVRKFPGLSKLLGIKFMERDVEDFFNKLIKNTVETRDREGIVRPDMIQLMMESRNNKPGEGPNLTIQDMTSQAFVFFFGGFETTSSLMCFVAHIIAVYPEVQERLQEEIDGVYEQCKGNITHDLINNMQYLDAVINETMRFYAIGPVLDRICTKDFELPPALPGKKPVLLKPNNCLLLAVYSIQRDSKYFSNPEEFNPERFIENPQETLHSSAFIPFGSGPRMCIGNRFALLETKVLIFYLLAKCSLAAGKQMILPLRFSKKTFNPTAEGGFYITLSPRNKWRMKNSEIKD